MSLRRFYTYYQTRNDIARSMNSQLNFVIVKTAPKIRVVSFQEEEEYNKPHIAIQFVLYKIIKSNDEYRPKIQRTRTYIHKSFGMIQKN